MRWLGGTCCNSVATWYNAPETGGPGCCTLPIGELKGDCCNNEDDIWDPIEKKCIDKCACEKCCEFNCCDELDYFMHKAFEEFYVTQYNSFSDYYAEWYNNFYEWWVASAPHSSIKF